MYSLRRSLTSYLLALLVVMLAVVGFVIDRVTGKSLAAREASSTALLDTQYAQRCREERQRLDEELLQEARKLGRELHKDYIPRVQKDYAKFSLARSLLLYGNGQALGTSLMMANPSLYFAQIRDFFSRLPIDEAILRNVEDPERPAAYFQVFSASGRANWRSESLQGNTLPYRSVDDWTFDETELQPQPEAVRRVVMRVSLNNPTPFRSRLRSGQGSGPGGPGPPPPGGPGSRVGPTPPGPRPVGPGPSFTRPSFPQFMEENPVIFVQCARPLESLTATLAEYSKEHEAERASVAAQIAEERRQLREDLLLIGLATFLGIAIGGPLLVGFGLRPLRDLSMAVSQVSERDFKLPHDGKGLPQELSAIHARLTHTLDMLRRAFAREKQAVADISHELRTPIASLQATLDVALRKPRTAEQYRTTLDECRLINKQLGQLVERIMTLASLDAGRDCIETLRIEASEIAVSCAAVIRPLAVAQNLELEVDVETSLELETDPDKLREVLMNLLHNAVEYNQPGGRVELRGWRERGHICFEVRDTGIGMTSEVRDRIFERFFRADASRHATGIHAGLGLAIVHEYVGRLNGTIRVESEPGAGSCFHLEFPAPRDEQPARSEPRTVAESAMLPS